MAFNSKRAPISSSKAIADAASWCCACFLVSLLLLCIFRDISALHDDQGNLMMRSSHVLSKPSCDEIYVVGEGLVLKITRSQTT
ncbi:hypothetical protein JHK85_026872 [Glycine max]|nr:hypothetical protein JHK85_026872 [Glycine max]